ncbi:MAG TPA: SGNH/GDSL hydrolase family protein [Acetobacteraceae bacterium]
MQNHVVRRFAPLALVLGVLSMMGAIPASAAAVPPDATALPHVAKSLADGQSLRIVAFGSSSTEGVGASSKATSYPIRLQAELAASLPPKMTVTVENRGIGGEDVDDMMRRIPTITAEKPDLVIWQTGTNDPLRDVKLGHFITQTQAGIAAFRAAGIDVMLMGPQLCAAMQDKAGAMRFRDAVRQIGEEMHVPVIHRYSMMERWLARKTLTEDEMLSPDGLHMADGGYHLLAMAVARQILGSHAPKRLLAGD